MCKTVKFVLPEFLPLHHLIQQTSKRCIKGSPLQVSGQKIRFVFLLVPLLKLKEQHLIYYREISRAWTETLFTEFGYNPSFSCTRSMMIPKKIM